MTLAEYLLSASAWSHVWGTHDCCTFPAGQVLTWGLGDPMQRWRGRYSSEAEACAYIDNAGGLNQLWAQGMADIGALATDNPKEGDVGVVEVIGPGGRCLVGALHTGRRWCVLAPKGLIFFSADPVAAWTRPHG